jgi:hypothetical protein
MTTGVFATARDHAELMAAIRKRIQHLNITLESLELAAGLPSRYCPKILGKNPIRRTTPYSIHLLLQALGLEIHLVESPELTAQYTDKLERSRMRRACSHSGGVKAPVRFELGPDFLKRIGRLGGLSSRRYLSDEKKTLIARQANNARNAALNPEQRSLIARRAAEARWRRVRDRQSKPLN